VEKTSLFGAAVHAVLSDASVSVDRVLDALARAGTPASGAETVVPSLEDVFLDVVDRLRVEPLA